MALSFAQQQAIFRRLVGGDTAAGASAPAAVASAPAAGRIAAAPDALREIYTFGQTGVTERAFHWLKVKDAEIYCIGGVTNGILQPVNGDVSIGKTPQFLTETRAVGEQGTPYLIPPLATGEQQSAEIYAQGTAGDQMLIIYRRS